MATQNVEILSVNTKPSQQSIASLRKEIKDLKGELLSLEQGTKEYNETLAEVANKTHQLKEITEQVNRSSADFGDRLANVQGTVAGLSGAFQTVLGSLSLMGVELGDDVKMLKMLQSAMAITQGVAAIDSGVKAFRALTISIKASTAAMSGLKKALIGTGIGAAAIAVGILVSKLSELKRAQDEAAEAARKHNEELREQLKVSNQIAKAEGDYYNRQYQQLNIVQALEKKLADNRAYWQEEYRKGNINQLQLDQRLEEERVKYVTNAGEKMRDVWQTILAHNTDANWKATDEGKRAWKDYYTWRAVAAYGDLEEQKALMIEWEKYTADAAKEVKATVKATEEAVKPQGSLSIVENVTVQADTDRAEKERQREEAELQALTEYYQRRADIIINNEKDVDTQLLQLDMDYRDQREELLRTRLEDGLITQQDFNNELAQLEVEAAELQIEQEQAVTDKIAEETEKRKKIQENYLNAIKSVIGSITSIMGSMTDTLEQGTQEWKALKTAEAIIETIAGGITAYMTTMKQVGGGVQGIIAGAAAAAAVLAAGYAEVRKIQATEVSRTATGTASVGSTPSASAVSVNTTQVTPTRMIQTEEDIANLPDTRVYVTEEDISRVQNRVRVTLQNATY